jgi:hypothetical protein
MSAAAVVLLGLAIAGLVVGSLWLRSIARQPDDDPAPWRYRDR